MDRMGAKTVAAPPPGGRKPREARPSAPCLHKVFPKIRICATLLVEADRNSAPAAQAPIRAAPMNETEKMVFADRKITIAPQARRLSGFPLAEIGGETRGPSVPRGPLEQPQRRTHL